MRVPAGPYEVTTRFAMDLTFWFSPIPKLWKPTMVFTGRSIYTVDPKSWRIISHRDTWDSVSDSEFFSTEAVGDLIRQMAQFDRIPDIESPPYQLLTRARDYEVRSYPSIAVAEYPVPAVTPMQQPSAQSMHLSQCPHYVLHLPLRGATRICITSLSPDPK